jgi:hypothetical protein
MKQRRPLFALALALVLTACAPRRQLCAGLSACPSTSDCVAGQCLAKTSGSPYVGTRRIILPPSDVALLDPDTPPGRLPAVFTMGRAGARSTRLLLRFDLKLGPGTTLVRASLLLDRSDATMAGAAPVALHGERVIGKWNPRTVSSSTAPPVEDIRLPRTRVDSRGPALVRIDVTDLARRWLEHNPADRGLVLVAENTSPTGVSFALGGDTAIPEPGSGADLPEPPRLEVYAR